MLATQRDCNLQQWLRTARIPASVSFMAHLAQYGIVTTSSKWEPNENTMIVFRTRQHAGIKNHCAKTAQDCAGFTLHPGLPGEEIFWRSPRCLCLPHLCLTLVGLQLTKLQFHRIWWDLPQWMPRCFCSTEGHPEKTTSFCFRKNNILASGNLSSRSRERGCASDMHVPSAIQIAHNHWSRAKKIRTVASSRLTQKHIYIQTI